MIGANVKHGRKAETFNIDGSEIVVEAYQKTYMRNPAGFQVKIRGTDHAYHLNVLEIDEAISLGLHKFLQRELGLSDMMTYMNVNADNWTGKTVTLAINARDGKFMMSNLDGQFSVKEVTDCTTKECGMRQWDVLHPDWAEKLCTVIKAKDEKEYTAVGMEIARTGRDVYDAAAKLLCNII
jgi:hypothetical protein